MLQILLINGTFFVSIPKNLVMYCFCMNLHSHYMSCSEGAASDMEFCTNSPILFRKRKQQARKVGSENLKLGVLHGLFRTTCLLLESNKMHKHIGRCAQNFPGSNPFTSSGSRVTCSMQKGSLHCDDTVDGRNPAPPGMY